MDIFRIPRDNSEASLGCIQLIHNPHAHMPFHERWLALGMERNKIKRNRRAVRRALVVLAMLQKAIQKCPSFLRVRSRACRSANHRIWQRRSYTRYRVVIELEILGRRAVPVSDIRLIPHLEVPRTDLLPSIALHKVLNELSYQFAPHRIVFGRIVGSSSHRLPGIVNLVLIDSWHSRGKVLRHESKFHEWSYSGLLILVEGLVGDREVVHRPSVGVQREYVRRTPFELRHSVPRCQQMMRSDVHRHWT